MSTLSSSSRRSGFSLIEVAIALAIFVFGALAIVQIFPPALGVIRNNESRTIATQLSESTLARMSTKATPPPEAIFDVDPASTQPHKWNNYPAAVVGTVTKNNSLPNSPDQTAFNNSALGHYRYIYGEPHYIGAGQTVMLNHPYDDTGDTLSFFRDEIIEGVQVESDGFLDFTNATNQSTGAPFSGASKLPPSTHRGDDFTYYISYRWHEGAAGSPINGVIEEPLIIPSLATSARVFACSFTTTNRALPGGVKVRLRSKIALTPTGALDLGSQRKIISIQNVGSSPATLYCNYLASDWRNIVTDSAPNNNIVELPISGIDTGSIIGILTNANQTAPPSLKSPDLSTPAKQKQAEKGKIEFLNSSGVGARLRTVYRTLDGWAHQPSVAPRSYIPYSTSRTGNFPSEPWREYFPALDGSDMILVFHASEAGKSVIVSYEHNSGGTRKKVSGALLTIGPRVFDPGTFGNVDFGHVVVARLPLPDAQGAPSFLSVQGASIHARTAWQNGDRYNQVIVPGYRTLMQ